MSPQQAFAAYQQLLQQYDDGNLVTDAAICWKSEEALVCTDSHLDNLVQTQNRVSELVNDAVHCSSIPDQCLQNITGDVGSNVQINAKIFKVCAANTVYIEYSNGQSILFDCGIDIHNCAPYQRTLDEIKKLKPTTIIISHWHSDHCNLLENIKPARLRHVIIPDRVSRNEPSRNALAKCAEWETSSQHVQIIDYSTYAGKPYAKNLLAALGYPRTSIYQGLGIRPANNLPPGNWPEGYISYDNTENDTSIILTIKTPHNDSYLYTIFPGDASYLSWPQEVKDALASTSRMLLPHHGGHVFIPTSATTNHHPYITLYLSNSGYTSPLKDRDTLSDTKECHTKQRTFLENTFEYFADASIVYTSSLQAGACYRPIKRL